MRQGQNQRRPRGRGGHHHNHRRHHQHHSNNHQQNVPLRHQTFDSNGPGIRIRGNAFQICDKYMSLARDATASGDRIAAENYFQHAEHYARIIALIQEAEQAYQQSRTDYAAPAPQNHLDGAQTSVAPAQEEAPPIVEHPQQTQTNGAVEEEQTAAAVF